MLSREIGRVKSIIYENEEIQELFVIIEEQIYRAFNFTCFTGRCKEDEEVLLNTTAISLNLGTGGYHYIIARLQDRGHTHKEQGHIMKLRYTPLQMAVQTMEEQDSPYHNIINEFKSLRGMPIIIGSLHSMITPALVMVKYLNPKIKTTYIMTDGASLPLSISRTVRDLKEKKILDSTITYGHAFGGDYEAVNIYTALIGAKEVVKSDIAIVAMGPGIVGTGTHFGFTGIEQGTIIDAVNTLGGTAIAIPRISFADKRDRHYGLSHHSRMTFSKVSKTKAIISIPKLLDDKKQRLIDEQLKEYQIAKLHDIEYLSVDELKDILNLYNIQVSTMGRSYDQDSIFFQSAAAAGKVALDILRRGNY